MAFGSFDEAPKGFDPNRDKVLLLKLKKEK
jgi:hypothetical protein